jgi:hypothetical protein
MDAFQAYKIYLALKNHFNSKNYDYFKYNGRTRASHTSFEKRSDRYFFYKLAKRGDCVNYLVSNFIEGDCWVGDLVNEQTAEKTYRKWKRRIESLGYIYDNDLNALDPNFNKNLLVENGQYPFLLKQYLRKNISPETILIINDLTGCFELWNKKIEENILWPTIHLKLKKYRPFFTIDLQKYRTLTLEKFNSIS